MANPNDSAIAIEHVIHKTLREALQQISEQHGIQLLSLHVDWTDVSTPTESKFIVREIRAETSSSR